MKSKPVLNGEEVTEFLGIPHRTVCELAAKVIARSKSFHGGVAMLPSKSQIEIPLLQALYQLGGSARPKDVYPLVTAAFPDLSEKELSRELPSGGNAWTNRIQWTRLSLIKRGEMSSPSHGLWSITEKGIARIMQPLPDTLERSSPAAPEPEVSLEELFDRYQEAFRQHLLAKLLDLSPTQFEAFARQLLRAYGFVETHVTAISQDGGIDGYGRLRVGLATMNVAFQCKRWQSNVGRPEIDKFRGAIQGEYEQGIFFTTSTFSSGAKEASIKKGAVPVILLDGPSIVELMIAKGFGVERRPLELYYDRLDSIFVAEENEQGDP